MIPFRKILIANRGEIALRIIRAALQLQVTAVALYAEEETSKPWVLEAGEAYSLGSGTVKETYLNIQKIIDIARKCGADAIHPGYGFLSENPLFARACLQNDIVFIGPGPEILELMGDKIAARERVAKLGIPVPPRYLLNHNRDGIPAEMSFPLVVKAASGGGGRGMRLVGSASELTSLLELASAEAAKYFADDRVYLEKYLHPARHIEVQLLGDTRGSLIHLHERECSVQRRHQKVIEEAPALSLPPNVRQEILNAALTIGRDIGYVNAGTVEFLVDDQQNFYFLEMNPRIQVEHGVTELITGIDVVIEQIRVAAGMPLNPPAFSHPLGCAIEVRVYAEDPLNDLLPAPGTILAHNPPILSGVRIDAAMNDGTEISDHYDPLISKVMVHADNRPEAIARLKEALSRYTVSGVRHNMPLLKAILADDAYVSNNLHTGYLPAALPRLALKLQDIRNSMPLEVLASAYLIFRKGQAPQPTDSSVWSQIGFWRILPHYSFTCNGKPFDAEVRWTGSQTMQLLVAGAELIVTEIRNENNRLSFCLDGREYTFWAGELAHGCELSDDSFVYTVAYGRQPGNAMPTAESGINDFGGEILAPLFGRIASVKVKSGDRIERGDKLVVIESMKLENAIVSPAPGIVQHVFVNEGDQVQQHALLLSLDHSLTFNS